MKKKKYKYGAVIGANGSGKGTVCKALHDEHGHNGGFVHVEMSKVLMLRRAWDKKFDEAVSGYMARQELVPDDMLKMALGDYLKHIGHHRRILFDGVPRSYQQANDHYDLVQHLDGDVNLVIIVPDITKEWCLERCRERFKILGRDDDSSDEKILKRFWKSQDTINQIVDFYRARDIRVHRVSGCTSKLQLLFTVRNILEGTSEHLTA